MSRIRLALLLGSMALLFSPAAAAAEPTPATPAASAPAPAASAPAASAPAASAPAAPIRSAPAASAASAPAAADSATPPPFVAQYPSPSARGTLALAGAGVFAFWYGAAIGESFLWPDAPEASKLRIPVVGPWLTLAHAGCGSGEAGCTDLLAVVRAVLVGITAVGQVGGLGALGEAAFLPTSSGERALPPARAVHVQSVTVVADERGIGLGLSGAF